MSAPKIEDAISAERERCRRIVAEAKPNISGLPGIVVQMMNGNDWMENLRKEIIRKILEGEK